MEMKEFALKVQKAVEKKMGEDYEVKLHEVQKNNGITLQGLSILTEEKNVSPTIYLEPFWEAYERGIPFAAIMQRLLQIYYEDTPKESVDMSFFKEFEQVKERICFRLISAERNRELLKKVPYIEYLDLAICFHYAYQGDALGNGSILIYNSHLRMWDATKEELFELARCNTPRLFAAERISMEETVKEMLEQQEEADVNYHDVFEAAPMYVVSNEGRVFGAAGVLYPGVLQKMADEAQKNLYVLPSSIHEIIVLYDSGHEDTMRLREIIGEVNGTQVEPEEILSDNLYYFDRLSGKLSII